MATNIKYRKCNKCGDDHDRSEGFRHCVICRIAVALSKLEWRHGQIERKLCTECVKEADFRTHIGPGQLKKGRMRKCKKHHAYHLAYYRSWTAARKRQSYRKAA